MNEFKDQIVHFLVAAYSTRGFEEAVGGDDIARYRKEHAACCGTTCAARSAI